MKIGYYIRKYPLSLVVVLAIIYLSFFKPPTIEVDVKIPHLDKFVHFCMYFGLSGILWWEFLRSHKDGSKMWHAWVGAFICPVLFSGLVEILQSFTAYRGGDWLDFLANTLGAATASSIAYYFLFPRMVTKN